MARKTTRSKTTSSRKKPARRKTTRRKTTARRGPRFNFSMNMQQKALIFGIFLIFLTAIIILSLLSPNQGRLTAFLSEKMWQGFGLGGWIFPIALIVAGFYLVLWGMDQPIKVPKLRLFGLIVLFVSLEALLSNVWLTMDNGLDDFWAVAREGEGGGYLGSGVSWGLNEGVGQLGTVFVLLVVGILAGIIVSGVSRQEMGSFLSGIFSRRPSTAPEREIIVNTSRSRARSNRQTTEPPPEPVVQKATLEQTPSQPKPAPTKRPSRSRKRTPPAPQSQTAATGEQEQVIAPTPVFMGNGGNQSWTLPELSKILEVGGEQNLGDAYIRDQVTVIEQTLESFGAPATVVEINQGPTITQYGVEPSFIEQRSGKRTKVKVGKIAGLADDLTLALSARSIRIQAPVPGKGYVGIEVPNTEKALVSLRDVMEATEFQRINSPLRIGLGQNVAGQPIATDLAQMPHLLIAGTTGAGKSVCVNSIIACLLLQNTPADLKIVMVDPKRVELTGYNGIPHLVAPVVVELERVVGTLQWAMREMDNRYKRLAEMGVRNITEYNRKAAKKGDDKIPYIVIIIDELADLMMLSPEETERGITRLAQLARATGIHMVISTQRPSVDVVTGIIKANFPARVAFAVASSTDSRVILDTTGAERLLGQGDMLFQSPDAAAPIRMQGCFVSEAELGKLINYWQGARRSNLMQSTTAPGLGPQETERKPQPGPEPTQPPLWEEMQEEEAQAEPSDELLPEAIALVRQLDKASTSMLQRHFRIGYTRAARLIDSMEEQGVVGPPTGTSKPRVVLPGQADISAEIPAGIPAEALLDETNQLPSALESDEPQEQITRVDDELLPEAITMVRDLNKASTSLLQRRFRIDYNRAAQLMDAMQEQGVIGPASGTGKTHQVFPPEDEAA
jgi:S-DNA-T family DNA segregation ATPase FtsK/SpoIIIE